MNQPSSSQSTQTRPPGSAATVTPLASGSVAPRNPGAPQASGATQAPGATQATAKEAQAKAGDVARSVEKQAAAASEQVKRQASEVVRSATKKTYEAAERAKQNGRQYADEKKQVLAKEIDVFSSAIRKASTKLHDEEHVSIASYLDAAVERLDEVRDALQQKSVSELLDDAGRLARRRPELVYGGMFLAGLAAVRFLKASNRRPSGANEYEHEYEQRTPQSAPPVAGAVRPGNLYPQTPAASPIHRNPGFPDPLADTPNQITSPGELR